MIQTKAAGDTASVRPFRFESYGVQIEIVSNEQEMVDEAAEVARVSLLHNIREIKAGGPVHRFQVNRTKGGNHRLIKDDQEIASGRSRKKFFKFFDSIVRITIGEFAADKVFVHAGVVGWRGKAIVLPAESYQGKTTLVSELVRNGAEYYSDDFAIFDQEGLVHPFSRRMSMRTADYKVYELTVAELGGTYGELPIPVGMVLFTGYVPGRKRWQPKMLTAGQGVLELIPYVLSMRHKPDFSMNVLNNLVSRAIIASSPRGNADKFAKTLLNFVDKFVY